MKKLILVIVYFFALFITKNLLPNSIVIEGENSLIPVLEKSKVFIDKTQKSNIIDIINLHDEKWEAVNKNLHSFGFDQETVWIKFKIRNLRARQEFFLVSEYPWLDHVNFYQIQDNKIVDLENSGDKISFNKRKIQYRLPTYSFHLDYNEEAEFYISINSFSEKLLSISLEDKIEFLNRDRFSRNFFIPYSILTIVVLFINGRIKFLTQHR